MTNLYIDPGSKVLGVTIESNDGSILEHGRFYAQGKSERARIESIESTLANLIQQFGVDEVYAENTSHSGLPGETAKEILATVKRHVIWVCTEMHRDIWFVSPMTIKAEIVNDAQVKEKGEGNAKKHHVIAAVKKIYGIDPIDDNHADSLALKYAVWKLNAAGLLIKKDQKATKLKEQNTSKKPQPKPGQASLFVQL